MTEALKIRVLDLFAELAAHALVVLITAEAAGTVAVFCGKSFAHGADNFFVGIFDDLHMADYSSSA